MNSKDIQEYVTTLMLNELAKGVVPWRKPWNAAGTVATNLASGKAYRGVNRFILPLIAAGAGYESNYWVTYKQAQERGGQVRKGEKASQVIFWKMLKVKDDAAPKGEKTVPMLRSFAVFNSDQCDGLAVPQATRGDVVVPDAVQNIWDGYTNAPSLTHSAQDRAYYSPFADAIMLPPVDTFVSATGYAETLFHEMTHSTGHKTRLGRLKVDALAPFGAPDYAKEELVAEMGAAMLAAHAGIELDIQNNAAYIHGWLKALENDQSLVISAAGQAQKALDLITGVTFENAEEN